MALDVDRAGELLWHRQVVDRCQVEHLTKTRGQLIRQSQSRYRDVPDDQLDPVLHVRVFGFEIGQAGPGLGQETVLDQADRGLAIPTVQHKRQQGQIRGSRGNR